MCGRPNPGEVRESELTLQVFRFLVQTDQAIDNIEVSDLDRDRESSTSYLQITYFKGNVT